MLRAARAVLAALAVTTAAHAGPSDVVALPASAATSATPDSSIDALLPHLDQLVGEAVQDSDLRLSLEPRAAREVPSDEALVTRARDAWVVLPTLQREGRALRVRLVAVRPGTRVLLSRSELCSADDLDVRVAVMMRDLLQARPESAVPAARAPVKSARRGAPCWR
jgi:hypothetical protein